MLTKIGLSSIPLSLIFEGLGYTGASGVEWGILSGVIAAFGAELGYDLIQRGRKYYLVKKKGK